MENLYELGASIITKLDLRAYLHSHSDKLTSVHRLAINPFFQGTLINIVSLRSLKCIKWKNFEKKKLKRSQLSFRNSPTSNVYNNVYNNEILFWPLLKKKKTNATTLAYHESV